MEKKLHPLFYSQNANGLNIQAQFDPTPTNFSQNLQPIPAAEKKEEHFQETQLRINRLVQKVGNLEERTENIITETRAAYAQMAGRIKERILHDSKIESLIERHNQMVNTFEKRLSQMAKLVEDSQTQLFSTQGSLEEARREIARLKRL